jgi:predicted alpha/beta superfamily hydrolase
VVRVWIPDRPPTAVLYLNDGQNVFAAPRSPRVKWRADEAARSASRDGSIEPLAIVAVDHGGGQRRWREYLPYADPRNPRATVFEADRFADFVVRKVMPAMARLHPELAAAVHVGAGGSSYGAVAAFHSAVRHPGVFDRLLLESPVLWVGEGKLLAEAENVAIERVFIGMGTRESRRPEANEELVRLARSLARRLSATSEVRLVVGEGAPHHEIAWAERLPEALRWLFPKPGRPPRSRASRARRSRRRS